MPQNRIPRPKASRYFRASLEQERKGAVIWPGAASQHVFVQKDGFFRIVTVGVATNGDVPRECIGITEVAKDSDAVRKGRGVREGAEGDKASGGEWRGDEVGKDHLSVNLLEVPKRAASIEEGEEEGGVGRMKDEILIVDKG